MKSKEQQPEQILHLTDGSNEFFAVISWETRSRQLSKKERLRRWGEIRVYKNLSLYRVDVRDVEK